MAAPTRIMAGADFSSLEDRISALLTKDTNKLKVYIEKYDGHCLRAFAYFPDKMPDVVTQMTFKDTDTFYEIINNNGSITYMKGSDILQPFGKSVEELYNEKNIWI